MPLEQIEHVYMVLFRLDPLNVVKASYFTHYLVIHFGISARELDLLRNIKLLRFLLRGEKLNFLHRVFLLFPIHFLHWVFRLIECEVELLFLTRSHILYGIFSTILDFEILFV